MRRRFVVFTLIVAVALVFIFAPVIPIQGMVPSNCIISYSMLHYYVSPSFYLFRFGAYYLPPSGGYQWFTPGGC